MSPNQRKSVATVSAAVLLACAAMIKPFEGKENHAYPDIAHPAIITICYGETKDVKLGDYKTDAECEAMLVERLPDYLGPIYDILPDLPDNRAIAYGSATWNLGTGLITLQTCAKRDSNKKCVKYIPGTSIYDMEKAGDWKGACTRLLQFVYAGNVKYNGLVRRRQAEYKVCVGEAS